jgi:hypothetical protein
LIEGFTKGLDNFIVSAAKRNRQDACAFDAWKSKILAVLMAKCDTLFAQENSPSHSFLSKKGMDELHQIHKDMVVTYADKSSHDFVLCCKHVYKKSLWQEIHSDHYEEEKLRKNSEIWAEHSKLSDMVGKPAVNAHRYLYGILKIHKFPIGMRWIAGNHMQDVGDKDRKFPACSLSTTEMILGGVLRMCMHNLESKDKRLRKKGIKRYWVVTNVDRVAADIKYHVNSLIGQPVFTRDFTRMYTSIPQEELVRTVEVAIREVFEWHSDKTKVPMDELKVKVCDSRSKSGHTSAIFAQKGFSFSEVLSALKAVCTEVYFQQREDGLVRRQIQGLPMGGKASAELANLYCYVKESQYIDSLIAAGKMMDAKKWFHTWRYIDDLTGFGDRGDQWQHIDYGMEHIETTQKRYTTTFCTSQVVFLGMRIDSTPEGIFTSVQPKGLGWAWLPSRFIEYSSCHTHYTKWYMLKGLLIRALTICNTQEEFIRAAIHYSQGLISRGFPATTLWKAWRKFTCEKIPNSTARKDLTNQYKSWLDVQSFSTSHADENALRAARHAAVLKYFKDTMLPVRPIFNHILAALRCPTITEEEILTVAREMADREANILQGNEPHALLQLASDPRGNHAAETLLHLLRSHSGRGVERWRPDQPLASSAILLGSGSHWQAVLQDKDKHWFVLERDTKYALQNVARFLNSKLTNGVAYEVGILDELLYPGYLDTISQSQHSGRLAVRPHSSSPPKKRRQANFATKCSINLIAAHPISSAPHLESTLPGVQLPPEFLQNPRFAYEGTEDPTRQENPFAPSTQDLLNDLKNDVLMESSDDDVTERPQRNRTHPKLYQSDVIENEERLARQGKDKASSSTSIL